MMRGVRAAAIGVVVLGVSGVAHAQCSKDIDCKGERLCEAGQCVDPPALPEAPPAPAAAPAQSAPAVAPASAPRAVEDDRRFLPDERPPKPERRINSPSMLAGGILLTAAAPILLITGVLSVTCFGSCHRSGNRELGYTVGALALLSVGIPLIVIGAKRVPVTRVSAVPWLGPQNAGLNLRLDL